MPWAATPAASREPCPRKNLYFAGEGQDEVYDYLIWRANVRGYRSLTGEPARSSTEMVNDLLKRAYLRDMLDQDIAEAFAAWRRKQYQAAGIPSEDADLQATEMLAPSGRYVGDPRFWAFMRARCNVSAIVRTALWERQGGKCAVCQAERRLKIYREVASSEADGEATLNGTIAPAPSEIEHAELLAVCEPCRRRTPHRFAEALGSAA